MTEIDPDLLQPLVMVLSPDGVIRQFSKGCEASSGYPAGEVIGRPLLEMPWLTNEERQGLATGLLADSPSCAPRTRVETWVGRAGALRRIRWTDTVVTGEDGRPTSIVRSGVLEDVCSSHDVQTLAIQYHQAMETFFRLMSHELITPLMPIMEKLEDLGWNQAPSEASGDSIRVLGESWRQLHQVLTNVLNFAKIDSSPLSIKTFHPWRLATNVLKLHSEAAREKGIKLELRATGPLPESIETDKNRLHQILQHLVGNAVKFSTGGTVTVEVGLSPAGAGRGRPGLRFVVRDQGIGMSREQLANLGRPFFQADASATRAQGGSGLGLAITLRLAEQIRSRFEVESTPGRGSAFAVVVPIGEAQPASLSPELFPPLTFDPNASAEGPVIGLRGHVLLAEDSRENQVVVGHILQKLGLSYEIVDNGEAALERLAEKNFHLILMDMQMPVMDGYTATRILRERGMNLPVIALTAHVMVGDEERCLEAGCTDYLPKPIDRKRFRNTLARYLTPNIDLSSTDDLPAIAPAQVAALANLNGNGKPSAPAADDEPLVSTYESDAGFAPLIRDYVAGLPEQLASLAESIRASDLSQAKKVAHKLRGSGGMYGYPRFSELAGQLEDGITRSEPLCQLGERARALESLLDRMKRGLTTEADSLARVMA